MSTFKDVMGISINSEYFFGNNTFRLYKNENDRIALVFGRNGSGKSTIAHGFVEYVNSINPRTVDLKLITSDGTVYISPDRKPSKIFVFNEDYIDKNVKIKSDGLDTIVLLGEQVGFAEQIDQTEQDIKILVDKLETIDTNLAAYDDKKSTKCPEFWCSKITKTLREGWAEIQGIKINKKQKRATVNVDVIERIGRIKPLKSKESLQSEFDSKMKLFNSTESESLPILEVALKITYNANIYAESKELLSRTVSRPTLTDRESELLRLFGVDDLTQAKNYISEHVDEICPKCLRKITPEHRDEITEKINKIISRESENFKKELEKFILPELEITNYDVFKPLDEHLFSDLISKINNLNSLIINHNDIIQNKIKNPFDSMEYFLGDMSKTYDEVNLIIEQIEKKRQEYNNAISDRKELIKDLLELNEQIAYFDIKDNYKQYKKSLNEKDSEINKKTEINNSLLSFRTKLQNLNNSRKELKLAADILNKELQYIFYSSKRLELSVDSETKTYKLKSNGKAVPPSKISSGERNALALCYFFADMAKNMDAEDPYSDEMFLVIDDPVSSFDFENKIGIMSFLKYKFKSVFSSSESTKAIVLTHDVSFFMDFCKALEEISKYCSSIGKNATFSKLYLYNKEIKEFKYKKQNEYTDLINEIFEFAKMEQIDEDNTIGNQMRRVVEAFSTFSFKVGIDELSTKKEILDLLPSKQLKDYFENLMYRLVLNGESHTGDTARFFPRTDFYMHLSPEEKQRTARDILCFMYLINPLHILSHLKEGKDKIEEWIENIN